MSTQFAEAPIVAVPAAEPSEFTEFTEWDLDISIVEAGPTADKVIRMTDDGCNSTCATACSSCP
ncbi:FxLD family lanthipeptide [Actinocorallia sp. A-T 12471]|uniref:FxLD family lanthipeptide n=1 Tax=Actinocorallia sp. A-T 12471 TaxID=3089813 RepID=UPI0029D16BE6|nr:FxLD family lanthipeptide [Actinocorallia sp. A-T 12471]MDX6742931.1 FxLD family lanthipeptide [Actinocorallia sp. A-T 12471]